MCNDEKKKTKKLRSEHEMEKKGHWDARDAVIVTGIFSLWHRPDLLLLKDEEINYTRQVNNNNPQTD